MSSADDEVATDLALVDLGLFGRSLARLKEALSALATEPQNTFVRDSVVKRYEFTYELAVRSLSRYLQTSAYSSKAVEDLTFQGIIRRGDKAELLLSGWPEWKQYRDARNQTAHTYSERKADGVIQTAHAFVKEADNLLVKLTQRMAQNA